MYEQFELFDTEANIASGYMSLTDLVDPAAVLPIPKMDPEDKKTLTYLLFWTGYTFEGRQTCREYRAGRANEERKREQDRPLDKANAGKPYYNDDEIREGLGKIFEGFVGKGPILDALLRAHISAGYWTKLWEKTDRTPAEDSAKAIYWSDFQLAMSFINWKHWEALQSSEFSIRW